MTKKTSKLVRKSENVLGVKSTEEERKYGNMIGGLDLYNEEGFFEANINYWDYPNKAIDINVLGKIELTLSLKQAKELQADLNKALDLQEKRENIEKGKPTCFNSNGDSYPLCKGNESQNCSECCLYENMDEPHDKI